MSQETQILNHISQQPGFTRKERHRDFQGMDFTSFVRAVANLKRDGKVYDHEKKKQGCGRLYSTDQMKMFGPPFKSKMQKLWDIVREEAPESVPNIEHRFNQITKKR